VYRHKRVVFGVNCSPFLLSAVLELHLKSVSEERAVLANKLLQTVTREKNQPEEEYRQFKLQATELMVKRKGNCAVGNA